MSQLLDKKSAYCEEVHLKKTDPNYGKPKEGGITEVRRRRKKFITAFKNRGYLPLRRFLYLFSPFA
jgi:hypothetical protein